MPSGFSSFTADEWPSNCRGILFAIRFIQHVELWVAYCGAKPLAVAGILDRWISALGNHACAAARV
jgi:hypothetical protein